MPHPLAAGLVVKMKGADGTIPWYKTFESTAGASIPAVDGDGDGSMFVSYTTRVPCITSDTQVCSPGVDGYGRPTGLNAPIESRFLTKLAAADGCAATPWHAHPEPMMPKRSIQERLSS